MLKHVENTTAYRLDNISHALKVFLKIIHKIIIGNVKKNQVIVAV